MIRGNDLSDCGLLQLLIWPLTEVLYVKAFVRVLICLILLVYCVELWLNFLAILDKPFVWIEA